MRVLSSCLVLVVTMLAQKTGSILHGSVIEGMTGSTIIGTLNASACGSASQPSWCSGSDIGA
ncbi:MAG: hypothetical protein WBW36_21825, partial [Candidatus Sulfotelmatobacter sp.]